MRTTAVLSTIVLSAGLLAGCGGGGDSSSSGYCKDIKAAKTQFASFESGTPDFNKLSSVFDTMHQLADEAPSAVADDWKRLDTALTKLEKDLDSAGLSLKDLGAITSGQLPEGMTQDQLNAALPKLQSALQGLSGADLKKSTDAIQKHAKSKCGVDLNS